MEVLQLPPLARELALVEPLGVLLGHSPTPGASFPGTGTRGVAEKTAAGHILVAVAAAVVVLEFRSSVTEWELKTLKWFKILIRVS